MDAIGTLTNSTLTNSTLLFFGNSFVTFFVTIVGGLFVLVLGQIFIKLILEPIKEQKELVAEVSSQLSYYANIYTQPGSITDPKILENASLDIRKVSTRLKATTSYIPSYKFFTKVNLVIPEQNINTAFENLIGISNSLGNGGNAKRNEDRRDETKKMLGIKD
jgi:hypothetical protein